MFHEMLKRALGYPYHVPENDFVLSNGDIRNFQDNSVLRGRKPVLAIGSNRSPEQLLRKFGKDNLIPVTHAELSDYDVVYSAHIASYGSIPATLIFSPGTTVNVCLTWLSSKQLCRMHETEALGISYDYLESQKLEVKLRQGQSVDVIGCYKARKGCLNLKGAPAALSAVPARERVHPACEQRFVLQYVYSKWPEQENFGSWLTRVVTDTEFRKFVSKELASQAIENILPAFEVD